jgi:hypothetical protein
MLRKEKEKTGRGSTVKQDLKGDEVSPHRRNTGPSSASGLEGGPIGNRKWTVSSQEAAQREQEERNKTKICE